MTNQSKKVQEHGKKAETIIHTETKSSLGWGVAVVVVIIIQFFRFLNSYVIIELRNSVLETDMAQEMTEFLHMSYNVDSEWLVEMVF